ncbi:MAG: hypothetical protein J7K38_02185 [Thermoplasmata archaeon]|nr:hypothetical protein [Thermoplasmata archaeon]
MRHKFLFIILVITAALLSLIASAADDKKVVLEFFYSSHCGDCEEKIPVIDEIEQEYGDQIIVYMKDISTSKEYLKEWQEYDLYDVPAVVINGKTKVDYYGITKENLESIINAYLSGNITWEENTSRIELPFFGSIDERELSRFSLPVLAIVLGSIDGFNPCSFFVLIVLLNLLIYAGSKRKIALIGGIFIFFSGFIYFIFMSALLNIFVLTSHIAIITVLAGVIALFLGSLNIKDFFFFKKGISASIPDSKKPKLYQRMRSLLRTSRLSSVIVGTVILAISANTYELFCTLGFPMIFTRALTLHNLPATGYYFYLLLYNIAYVIPLIVIVTIFAITLGRKKLTQSHGRFLKLVSGTLMFSLGVVLLVNPSLLNNLITSVAILVSAISVSAILHLIWEKFKASPEGAD